MSTDKLDKLDNPIAGFQVIPSRLFDALRDGYINEIQFCIMCVMHSMANYRTAEVLGWSAEQYLLATGYRKQDFTKTAWETLTKRVRRESLQLKDAGWFHRDYRRQRRLPYSAWIHNYSPLMSQVARFIRDTDTDEEEKVLYPCSITACNGIRHGHAAIVLSVTILAQTPLGFAQGDKSKPTANPADNGTDTPAGTPADLPVEPLTKTLPRIAAEVLHRPYPTPRNLAEKFRLLTIAYGQAAIEADFRLWCEENRANPPLYPVTDYLKVIDTRLGHFPPELKVDRKDPRIAEITSLCYELSGVIPSNRSVANTFLAVTPEELISAIKEYVLTLEEKDIKAGMKTFFTEGGALAVVTAQRKRNQQVKPVERKLTKDERLDKGVDAIIKEAMAVDSRLQYRCGVDLDQMKPAIKQALERAVNELGTVKWSDISAVIKQRIASCGIDLVKREAFGRSFCENLVTDLRKLQSPQPEPHPEASIPVAAIPAEPAPVEPAPTEPAPNVPAEPEPPVIGDEKRCRELAKAAIRLINEREKFRSGRIRQKLEGTDEVINAASGTIVWVELAVEAVVDWDTLSEVIAEITPCKDTVEARSQFSGVFTDTLLKTMRAKTLADNLRAKMQSQQKEE